MSKIKDITMTMPGQIAFLCARCPRPALPTCSVIVTSLLGDVLIYLCQQDYEQLLEQQKQRQEQTHAREEEAAHFEQQQQALLIAAHTFYNKTWPEHTVLWKALREVEEQYQEARRKYRQIDEIMPAARAARLQVLRTAGLCLIFAHCLEARAQQDGSYVDAVHGTIHRVTGAFIKDGLVLPLKHITREEIATAALAIIHFRLLYPEEEATELQAIEDALGESFS